MKKNKLYLNILILIICLLPLKNVNAEMCRFKPVTTMMKYCDKIKQIVHPLCSLVIKEEMVFIILLY